MGKDFVDWEGEGLGRADGPVQFAWFRCLER